MMPPGSLVTPRSIPALIMPELVSVVMEPELYKPSVNPALIVPEFVSVVMVKPSLETPRRAPAVMNPPFTRLTPLPPTVIAIAPELTDPPEFIVSVPVDNVQGPVTAVVMGFDAQVCTAQAFCALNRLSSRNNDNESARATETFFMFI